MSLRDSEITTDTSFVGIKNDQERKVEGSTIKTTIKNLAKNKDNNQIEILGKEDARKLHRPCDLKL